MANNLFSLFDDQLKVEQNLVAGDAQSLSSISDQTEEQQRIIRKLQQFEVAESKVDYSDYKNFVFFNSALDYFNITGEKMLNEYPYDGSVSEIENFVQSLDGFQKYIVGAWPKNTGHLRFKTATSASYIKVEDFGKISGLAQVGILSPNTGSLSIEFWCNTSGALSTDAMIVLQKTSGSGDGYTVYTSASNMILRMSSGSNSSEVSIPIAASQNSYYAFVFDRDDAANPVLNSYSGSSNVFPVLVNSTTSNIVGPINVASVPLYIGSGTLTGKTAGLLSGTFDELRIWSEARDINSISSSFNTKIYAQQGLAGLWRFNESGSIDPDDGNNSIVLDYSGHRLNGRIQNYFKGIRGSGSMLPLDSPDLILFFRSPEVQALVADKQLSGSTYDRVNDNIITRLLPEQFFLLEEFRNTTVLQDFLYILARQFDFIKVKIDQFTNVLKTNYTSFNQAPDALLEDVGRFFGWEFTGNFLNHDAFQYLIGKNILQNQEANKEIDVKLYQIKNEFWKRVLINLMYLYKTKGTRESIESLLRLYGVNKNFVRVKEYGYKPNVGVVTSRILSEKTSNAVTFGSSSLSTTLITAGLGSAVTADGFPIFFPANVAAITGSSTKAVVFSPELTGSFQTIEVRVKFPTSTSEGIKATFNNGSIWSIKSGSTPLYQMYWDHPDTDTYTGSLHVTSSLGTLSLSNVGIFDDNWYNIAFIRNPVSSSYEINVKRIDFDEVDFSVTASATFASASFPSGNFIASFRVGSDGGYDAEMWTQEARVWSIPLKEQELIDHALNYQSYGVMNPEDTVKLNLHWRMNTVCTASNLGILTVPIEDVTGNKNTGQGGNFGPNVAPFKKFLNDYNYIASPDFSWNEDKIRVFNDTEVKPSEAFSDNNVMALEFNMVDALNEDISQIIATMDDFNNFIGLPANRYRESYHDIARLRDLYFKRLQGRLNFRLFSDMLEFFDRSFVDIVKKLIPARAVFIGEQFVVESHMLERPKLQWNYRRQEVPFQPQGTIVGRIVFSDDQVENVLQLTIDKSSLSGVIRNRHRKHITSIPDSIKGQDNRRKDKFGNPIFPGTGK